MKNVQTNEDLDVDENELEDLVCFLHLIFLPGFCFSNVLFFDQLVKAKEQQEKEYIENTKTKKSAKGKVRQKLSSLLGLTSNWLFSAYREKPRQLNLPDRTILWLWT